MNGIPREMCQDLEQVSQSKHRRKANYVFVSANHVAGGCPRRHPELGMYINGYKWRCLQVER